MTLQEHLTLGIWDSFLVIPCGNVEYLNRSLSLLHPRSWPTFHSLILQTKTSLERRLVLESHARLLRQTPAPRQRRLDETKKVR
jgi:hypothetical protein